MRPSSLFRPCFAVGPALLLGVPAFAQSAASGSPAASYDSVYADLQALAPRGDGATAIHDVTLRRDAIVLHFADGRLYPTTPVAGRSIGLVFVGRGSVSFVPPLPVERRELRRVLHDTAIDAEITAAVLLFTDSTAAELGRAASATAAAGSDHPADPLKDALGPLLDGGRHQVREPTLMDELLNGWANGFFYAHVKRATART